MMQSLAHYLWFKSRLLYRLLIPLSLVYGLVSHFRRMLYRFGIKKGFRAPIPVVVVGNLTVGGNGKTPVVLWLIEQLAIQSIKVAVISRGYGANPPYTPFSVADSDDPLITGDEPLLIYQRTGVDVVISANRKKAIELIIQKQPDVQLIISDDGLQHYALKRDVEWVVIDANKLFGNRHYLPAGPLRESVRRLRSVDGIILNFGSLDANLCDTASKLFDNLPNSCQKAYLQLEADYAVNLITYEKKPLSEFTAVNALAGIGFPDRFYLLLNQRGIDLCATKNFDDHHNFHATDLIEFKSSPLPLLMTEKDAAKCKPFANENYWFVPVNSFIPKSQGDALIRQVINKIKGS